MRAWNRQNRVLTKKMSQRKTLKRHDQSCVSVYECQGGFVLRSEYPVEVYKDKARFHLEAEGHSSINCLGERSRKLELEGATM